jgi:FdhD protein
MAVKSPVDSPSTAMPRAVTPVAPNGSAAGLEVTVDRWSRGATQRVHDRVAEEMPIALTYHGVPHVVMLATPRDLEDYAYGFTLSEELVAHPSEIRSVEVTPNEDSYEVRVSIAWERFPELLRRRRNLTGRTGCGLCGAETLEEAVRVAKALEGGPTVSIQDLHAAIEQLKDLQPLNAETGSVHAAAWVLPGQGIQLVREDVGRHNALDKAIGALVRTGADFNAGYMLVTSRASFEMVQKAGTVGISFLVAISAPTSLAIQHAEKSGLTLVGFARRDQHVVYTHPHRLVE